MRHLRTATLTTLTLLTLGGGLVWSATRNTPTPVASTGLEAAVGEYSTPSIPVRSTVHQSTSTIAPVQTSIPTETTQAVTKTTSDVIKTNGQQPDSTTKPKNTTTSTVKRPGKQKPAATTTVNPPSGDPNRIVDNGYINLEGVRVSTMAGDGKYGMYIVERCGRIGEQVVKIWFKYADGRIRDERWIFNGKQVYVFETDQFENPVVKRVYVEASGLDPYGESAEDGSSLPTEWIWCANRSPNEQ